LVIVETHGHHGIVVVAVVKVVTETKHKWPAAGTGVFMAVLGAVTVERVLLRWRRRLGPSRVRNAAANCV